MSDYIATELDYCSLCEWSIEPLFRRRTREISETTLTATDSADATKEGFLAQFYDLNISRHCTGCDRLGPAKYSVHMIFY